MVVSVNGHDSVGSDEQESGGVIRMRVVRSRDLVNWDWCDRGNLLWKRREPGMASLSSRMERWPWLMVGRQSL